MLVPTGFRNFISESYTLLHLYKKKKSPNNISANKMSNVHIVFYVCLCADESDDKDVDDKLKQQPTESSRRENTLVLRLTNKEQELQDCMV